MSDTRKYLDERASVEEVLEFVNEIRRAGGENTLNELLPSYPKNQESCLIARNVNFGSEVNVINPSNFSVEQIRSLGYHPDEEVWGMMIYDDLGEIGLKISTKLGLPHSEWLSDDEEGDYRISTMVLPAKIARVAIAFDEHGDDPNFFPEYSRYNEQKLLEEKFEAERNAVEEALAIA